MTKSQKKLSPGSVLLLEVIRWEFGKESPIEIDMTTAQDWNRNWQMSGRRYYQLRIYDKKTLAGLATYFRDRAIIVARQFNWLRKAYKLVRR